MAPALQALGAVASRRGGGHADAARRCGSQPVDGAATAAAGRRQRLGRAPTPPRCSASRRRCTSSRRRCATCSALAEAPRRLGLVDEVGGRRDLWRVRFDDALGSRVYLDGPTGVLLAVRTEAWVWYDFLFRLHVMDYSGGEDFNSTLMRVASTVAFGLVLAGMVLAVLALQRRWRRHRTRA